MKLRSRLIAASVWLLCLAPPPLALHAQSSPKAIVIAWDGAVPSLVNELLAQGKLPNLAKLAAGGAFSDDVTAAYPSLTAPGFASLWTGAPPRVTGISGNRVPRSQSTILESSAGFNPSLLRAETLWAVAERAGRRMVITHVPFGGEKSQRGVHFQGYAGIGGRDGVITGRTAAPRPAIDWINLPASDKPPIEIQFTIGASHFFGLFIDDRSDPRTGYDTLLVCLARDGQDTEARLKAGSRDPAKTKLWSGVLEVKTTGGHKAGTYLRLFALSPEGSDFLLYHTMLTRERVWLDLLAEVNPDLGAFVPNGAGQLYHDGALGLTIPKGGSGVAEARYLETVAFAHRGLMRTNAWALKHLSWDLFVAYTPFPDEAEHRWRGYLDRDLTGARKDIADRLRPFLEDIYRMCDELLGLFIEHRPGNTIIALVSDHGVQGVNKVFSVNRALRQSGLLAIDGAGRIDLARTKVYYPSINAGYLLINSSDRRGGIVGREERGEIISALRNVLFAIRDGDRQVVSAIYDAESDGEALGIGGPAGGDVYLDLLPGYELDARLNSETLIRPRDPAGAHGFNPRRMSMRTLMLFNGPGVRPGAKLTGVRISDFAPTLAQLLGIAAPKDATGRVLGELLIDPR